MRRWLWLLLLLATGGQLFADPVFVRVNQIGFRPGDPKIGLAMTNETLAGRTFRVLAITGGSTAFSSNVGADRGAYGNFAHVYELNFTTLTTAGRYQLEVNGARSYPFNIGAAAYASMIPLTLKSFRVQRCGNTSPASHGVCHLKDGRTTDGRTIDVTGGWHDAGDYLKFTATISATTDFLLTSYARHPEVFPDTDNNRIPDVLEEARVGLDWLQKMWDPARKILYYQVGDISDHGQWRMPDGDDANRPVRTVFACQPGRGANIAGKTAAALALASVIWGDPAKPWANTTLASAYLTAARQIYAFGKSRPKAQPSTSGFYGEISWKDDMALAAAELYGATREAVFLADAKRYAAQMGIAYTFDLSDLHGLVHYEIARLDPSYRNTAGAKLTQELNAVQDYAGKNSFGAGVDPFYWGCAKAINGAAQEAFWHQETTGSTKFRNLAQSQIDFLLGANPWGFCWVGKAGTRFPRHPHHQVADITRTLLPGFWDEGPMLREDWEAQGIALQGGDPLAQFQSAQAVYHDNLADYATNEPTIFTNALGIALLSWLQ